MCHKKCIKSPFGTVFQTNITQTKQSSTDKVKHLFSCVYPIYIFELS